MSSERRQVERARREARTYFATSRQGNGRRERRKSELALDFIGGGFAFLPVLIGIFAFAQMTGPRAVNS